VVALFGCAIKDRDDEKRADQGTENQHNNEDAILAEHKGNPSFFSAGVRFWSANAV
jgi:hypothetical protein